MHKSFRGKKLLAGLMLFTMLSSVVADSNVVTALAVDNEVNISESEIVLEKEEYQNDILIEDSTTSDQNSIPNTLNENNALKEDYQEDSLIEVTPDSNPNQEITPDKTPETTEENNDSKEIEEEAKEEAEIENADQGEVSEEMPAISITKTVDDYEISIECSEGTFAEGTTVEIKKIEDEEKEEVDQLVEEAITEDADEDIDIVKIVTFDVTFYDKDGNVVEPADENSVSIKIIPSDEDKTELENTDVLDNQELSCSVFHIEDDENVEEIECEVTDTVEEITFEAESFSAYSIVWYIKGDDGKPKIDTTDKGPQEIGGYIKSNHTFIDFTLPLEFTNEGNPVDYSLRPKEFVFEIYGRDTTGGEGIDHEEVLICEVTVPYEYYNNSAKTVTLKQSGKTKTEIPIYVVTGTQAQAQNGSGDHITEGFEYTVKFVGTGNDSIYTIEKDSTLINISQYPNQTEWSGVGSTNPRLSAKRQTLEPKKFYVSWVDNRNKEGKRPYSTIDNFTDESAKTEFKKSITLYRQVGDGPIEAVTDEMLPTTLAEAGPIVGRRDGNSISDWEITYNNLPAVSDGKSIKYFITVDDTNPSFYWYSPVMPEDIKVTDSIGKERQALSSGQTAKYIYSEDFTATVKWYDDDDVHGARLNELELVQELLITDDKDETIFKGSELAEVPSNVKITKNGNEWELKVGPLPMYDEQGSERSYKLVLKDGVIKEAGKDGIYEYSVDYSNVPKTTAHDNCLSDGKVILVIDRPLDSFKITKKWADNQNYESREETVESGVRFLLWRYPIKKDDGDGNIIDGTPADRAAVFNSDTHLQYSYTLTMNDEKVTTEDADGNRIVKDESEDITLAAFGVDEKHPVDMFDQNGYKYVYFATEVISKPGYITVYENSTEFKDYDEFGVMNGGTMTNVRQEKMKMEGIVKWNVPSVYDYTKTTVTIELQKLLKDGTWETLPADGDKVYTRTLSGFAVTNPKRSYVFPEVDRYDENGKEITYRVVQTKVDYLDTTGETLTYTPGTDDKVFVTNFSMNTKEYMAVAAPTPGSDDSYTIENRLAGDTELILTKIWKGSFGLENNLPYPNITINVFKHGVSTNYLEPYMTISTNETVDSFKSKGVSDETEKTVPCTIKYPSDSSKADETGVIKVTLGNDGRATQWDFKKKESDGTLSNISLPAFNENGNAYSYTVEESINYTEEDKIGSSDGVYTEYKYERKYDDVKKCNELDANVTNTYVTGGGDSRTVIFQKEWVDGTDIPQEKPIRMAIVRITSTGEFYYDENGKIDLKDNFGETHIVTLTENNNWYGQLGFKPGETRTFDDGTKTRFDKVSASDNRYLYTAIELDMALNGTDDDFSRKVKYVEASTAAVIQSAIAHPNDATNKELYGSIDGSIEAYLDIHYEENHLPGYDVTVRSGGESVIDSRKYVVVNKRKGRVNVEFNKTWQDGHNSEDTRTGTYRVYLYQNGKKVLKPGTSIQDSEKETIIKDFAGVDFTGSPAEHVYAEGKYDAPEDPLVLNFNNLPQYDENGNIYNYSVKEFLVKDGKELEIALTDTKDSSKTGYVVTDHSEETTFRRDEEHDKSILERKDTYHYTNTITGEKTGGAKFFVLWHDQTSYDKGNRPDVNYVLYYRVKGSTETPQVYKGEYKAEWHPMFDPNDPTEEPKVDSDDTTKASRYYQYVNFTKLPLANDAGEPYEYFAVPSLNNAGEHYDSAYYDNGYTVQVAKNEVTGEPIRTSANKYHYDIVGTPVSTSGTYMLPENGLVEYTINETIHVEGSKLWKLNDNKQHSPANLPEAEIYLWCESDHDKTNSQDGGTALATTNLNAEKNGYQFADTYPKYDAYGQTYTYSVTEKIFLKLNGDIKEYSIPNYVMNYRPDTNGITNVYNPEAKDKLNLRKFTVKKDWDDLVLGSNDKKPVAKFALYRIEIPLENNYYIPTTVGGDVLSANPTKDAYQYAANKFIAKEGIEKIGEKSVAYGANPSSVAWEDMPIFAPSGCVYLYFVEELNDQGINSFDYDVITDGSAGPAVKDINDVNTDADKTNILIKKDGVSVKAVLFSNYGLDPSKAESDSANWQEAGYKNKYKDQKFNKIVGYKTWDDGIFSEAVRPNITDINGNKTNPEVKLTLTRRAATQTGYGNQIATETIDPLKYNIEWSEDPVGSNKWKFVITSTNSDEEFKLYAKNGQPYTYMVTETITGNTLANYTITKGSVSGSESNVNNNIMTISSSSLQNTLKGQVKVFKKWDDALNELSLRSEHVNVLLQYRLVPKECGVGEYNADEEKYQWKNYLASGTSDKTDNGEYVLNYNNRWGQNVNINKLPVISNDGNYRYEYRLLETAFYDSAAQTYLNPINIGDLSSVPNGGLCTDNSSEGDRSSLYGNSTSPDEKYHNKSYELIVGSYHVNNSPISSLAVNTSGVSSMELRVDNRLSQKTSLKIEKRWNGVNVEDEIVAPVDYYGVLPDSITFNIEYKKDNDPDTEWKPLLDSDKKQVSIKVDKKVENGSAYFVNTVENLPLRSEGYEFVYRAIEQTVNLGRFDGNPQYVHDPAIIEGDREICHTVVTNTLPYRDITIKKKWNAEDGLRKDVTVELWSNNFIESDPNGEITLVNNTTKTLQAENGWEVTYKNLPVYNTKHEKINYYVKEAKVDSAPFSVNNYDIYFFDQISKADEEEVYEEIKYRYRANDNIAPIPENAYKVFIVNTPKRSLQVKKIWNDENNRQGLRLNVNVTLTNDDGISIAKPTQVLTTVDNSSVTWNYLPLYKKPDANFVKGSAAHTDEVGYTITEANTLSDKGYETPEYSFNNKSTISASGYKINISSDNTKNVATITNTYHPPKIKFTTTKEWVDENNRHYTRPVQEGIYLTLYYSTNNSTWIKVVNPPTSYKGGNYPDATGVYTTSPVTQHVTSNDTNTWGTPVWEGLPTKVSKNSIYYKVFETDANGTKPEVTPGYSATYSPASINVSTNKTGDTVSQVVTNKIIPTSLLISKEWVDTYDVSDRPDAVTFVIEYRCGPTDSWKIYKNPDGTVLKVTLSDQDHKSGSKHIWEKVVNDLPSRNSKDVAYEYRVKEVSITYGSDEILDERLSAETVSDHSFSGAGSSWTVESTVGAYKSSVQTAPNGTSFKATAVNTPIMGQLTVTKKWDDESNRDGLRPKEIKLQLYRKQDEAKPVEYGDAVIVSGTGNDWTYTFENLPVYNNDAREHTEENRSVYYVKEVNSEHEYKVTYTSDDGQTTDNYADAGDILKHDKADDSYSNSVIITNKHTPVRIKITATKEWIDHDSKADHNARPSSIEFILQFHIDGQADGTWTDVTKATPDTPLNVDGMEVRTTSVVKKILNKEKNPDPNRTELDNNVWNKDTDGKIVVWENLPAYVNNGKKVQYRILESDSEIRPGEKISDHYYVVYTECEYKSDEGTDYSLKVENILHGMGGILTVYKKWNPDKKDDIAEGDIVIKKIICHLEQYTGSAWENLEQFELTHENDWQHVYVHQLSTSYKYKVVEDAIVYDDGSADGLRVNADENKKKIGSFVCNVEPGEIGGTDEDGAQMPVTLTNKVPDNSITVTKIWDDENNREGVRPHSITVALYRDGHQVGDMVDLYPKSNTVGSDWDTYTWHNLPVYQNGTNNNSVYTVKEFLDGKFNGVYDISYSVDGGVKTANKSEGIIFNDITFDDETGEPKTRNVAVSITNQHKPDKKKIIASKKWVDENDKYATRPKISSSEYHTYLMLLYKLEGQTNWQPVTKYTDSSADEISGGKLYKDHYVYTTSDVIQEIKGDNRDTWDNAAIWENLSTRGIDETGTVPVYNKEVSYMVIEVPGSEYDFIHDTNNSQSNPKSIPPKGYTASEPKIIDEEHVKADIELTEITNTLITTGLEVEKTWDDEEDKFKTRPENIRVKLERKLEEKLTDSTGWEDVEENGVAITVEIGAQDNWKASFAGLPLYDNNGKEYVYRAREIALIYPESVVLLSTPEVKDDKGMKVEANGGNYVSEMITTSPESGENKFKTSLTNKLTESYASIELTAKKVWKDENDRDRVRPDSVTVSLYRDNIKVDTQTITEPTWQYTWDKLPKYQNGHSSADGGESDYIITEDTVNAYSTDISSLKKLADDKYECTITNKHVPKKAVITADKKWLDSNNAYSTRPTEIYLRLMYKYDVESDSEFRPVPNYPKTMFDGNGGMYDSTDSTRAEGVFTTSEVTQKIIKPTGSDIETWAGAKWENLPLKASPDISTHEPMTVVYKVIEVPTADSTLTESKGYTGYEVIDESIDGDSLDTDNDNNVEVTNKLITAELDITKVFEDSENKFVSRPDSIEVQILRRLKSSDNEWDPVKVKGGLLGEDLIVTLTKDEEYCKKLTDIPKYDASGHEYEYTCLETNLIYGDKKISVGESNVITSHTVSGDETIITNTLVTTSLTVTKKWDDNSNARGARPSRIVFSLERKKTEDLVSQIISKLTELLTGKDGYEPFKMLKDGKEVPAEIIINGPSFSEYTVEGLPAYSEDGYPYSYRAIETKLIYPGREVLVNNGTSLYEKPKYQFDVIESGVDEKGKPAYKFSEMVVNKIIPLIDNPTNPDEHEPENPGPGVIVPKYEIIEDGDPEELPQKVTDKINELIDLPDSDISNEQVAKLYRDIVKILSEDPVFIDRLDEETADIVIRFLKTGVLGRRRTKLPKTGGVVGSVITLVFASTLIGLGMAIRPEGESKKKRSKKKKKAKK